METPPTTFQKYPALIMGAIFAGIAALITLLGAGGLDDGFQWNPDGYAILLPILTALSTHTQTFSQATVDKLATRSAQQAVVKTKNTRAVRKAELR